MLQLEIQSPRQVYTKPAQPEKFICWSVMWFPLGAVRILHLERETAHDKPTNRHSLFADRSAAAACQVLGLEV